MVNSTSFLLLLLFSISSPRLLTQSPVCHINTSPSLDVTGSLDSPHFKDAFSQVTIVVPTFSFALPACLDMSLAIPLASAIAPAYATPSGLTPGGWDTAIRLELRAGFVQEEETTATTVEEKEELRPLLFLSPLDRSADDGAAKRHGVIGGEDGLVSILRTSYAGENMTHYGRKETWHLQCTCTYPEFAHIKNFTSGSIGKSMSIFV